MCSVIGVHTYFRVLYELVFTTERPPLYLLGIAYVSRLYPVLDVAPVVWLVGFCTSKMTGIEASILCREADAPILLPFLSNELSKFSVCRSIYVLVQHIQVKGEGVISVCSKS